MAVLIGMSGGVEGKSFELTSGEVSIGRTDENTIVLDNAAVSSNHCVIVKEGDNYILRDLGSTNGTRLNFQDVKESALRPKDVIRIGSVELMFDGEMTGAARASRGPETQVEVTQGPAAAPESFDSISPFGARTQKEGGKGLWVFIIAVIGTLALAAVAYLFMKLVAAG